MWPCVTRAVNNEMSVLTMIRNIKIIHPYEITLIKIGEFYHVYGKDAYILAYLMKYKLNILEEDNEKFFTCGFPSKSLAKVEAKLENKKLNYMIADRRDNYKIDEFVDYKNLNCYEKIYTKAYQELQLKMRIDKIYSILLDYMQKEDIKKIIVEIEKILKI